MQAKGTTIKTLKDYVVEKHGRDGYERWLEALPQKSRDIIDKPALPSAWYQFEDALLKPLAAMGRMFYNGGQEGAWKQGRYTADNNLHGVYRAFVKIASPQFLIKNTAALWHLYYNGSQAAVTESAEGRAVLELRGIEPPERDYDHNVAGWIERALEICGCRQVAIAITNPAAGTTRFEVTWD